MTGSEPFGLVGRELAGYRIQAFIGRGSTAYVFQAEDRRLSRTVALKVLAPEVAGTAELRQRFLRQSRVAAALDHPNIVPIYDAGEADGLLYMAMRYVEGTNLAATLAAARPLSTQYVLEIAAQVAQALDAAHAIGLVHQDVKPANILISSPAAAHEPGHVYLSDFGTAPLTGIEISPADGVSGCFAPEQLANAEITPQVDVYGLGCVVDQALTDRSPQVRDIVATALAGDPSDRYRSCGEFVDALRAQLAENLTEPEPPAPEPDAARGDPFKTVRSRRRVGIVIALGVALVLAAASVIVAVGPFRFGATKRYPGSGALPITLEYPSDWVQAGNQTRPVFSPRPDEVSRLFVDRGGRENWLRLREVLQGQPSDVVGMLVFATADDGGDLRTQQTQALRAQLPANLNLDGTAPTKRTIGGEDGLQRVADLQDPAGTESQVRLICISAVFGSTERRVVSLVFFSSPKLTAYRQETFSKVVGSVRFTG